MTVAGSNAKGRGEECSKDDCEAIPDVMQENGNLLVDAIRHCTAIAVTDRSYKDCISTVAVLIKEDND